MKFNTILLLTKLAALGSAGVVRYEKRDTDKCSCSVDPSLRSDCGYYGITESECINIGCCWGSTSVSGAPWCFYTASGGKTTDCTNTNNETNKTCEVDPYNRKDCGYYGIKKEGCISSGCCWAESNISGIPWCFYPNENKSTTTTTTTRTTTKTTTRTTTKTTTTTTVAPVTTTTTTTTTTVPVSTDVCEIKESNRVDCGYYGIKQAECENSGCCWAESSTAGVPWCFKPTSPRTTSVPVVATTTTSPIAQPTEIVEPSKDAITIRFYKPSDWTKVNLWAWDDTQKNLYGDVWPGKEITYIGKNWYSYTFPEELKKVNILFNNGNAQTQDITGVTSSKCYMLGNNNSIMTTVNCGLENLDVCDVDASTRKQCGADGISKDQCMDLNCCYNETEGACYYAKGLEPTRAGTCSISNPLQRTQCGTEGITKKECTKLGCCYNELEGAPSCFNHGPSIPSCMIEEEQREQCGTAGISEDECTNLGCCFNASSKIQCAKKATTSSGGQCGKYIVTELESSDTGYKAVLDYDGNSCQKYDLDVEYLTLEATFETNNRLHIHIQPQDIENYPHNTDMPDAAYPEKPENETVDDKQYIFELVDNEEFNIIVKRKDGTVIFDNSKQDFIFEQQYIELSTSVSANANIYGVGEVLSEFKRNTKSTRQALFNADNATPKDKNLYGSHPFHVEVADDGRVYGMFLRNSHGMDFILEPGKLAYQINGGNIDLYFFMGPTLDDVVKQYFQVIGAPALLPYWSLGWHQCRYGYPNIDAVEEVVRKYKENNIPLDTMWIDIDYMENTKDFTYDAVNYPISRMKKFVENLKSNHQYYVNMIDPAISTADNYAPYTRGIEKDIFVKAANGENFVGSVWPGKTVFPDWHNPKVLEYWTNEIKLFKDIAMTDGNWIDMNEAANFCNGACSNASAKTAFVLGEFNPNNPPYAINHFGGNAALNSKNLDMDAQYYGGLIEYDIHNIYGHMESIVTYKALLNIDPVKRPFLLSRSTFSGTGKYAAHWLGDNHSTWHDLTLSISGMLNFQFFGIPMVGSDVCGFQGNADEELCARWMELGAFYPFGRNHNNKGSQSQEPYLWPKVAEASRRALAIRYKILPYMYTNLVRTHTHSEMMLYSLPFEWPTDETAINNDKQFLVGKGILVTPVLTEGATSVSGYFPEGVWYDWYTHESFSGPTTKTLSAELVHIPIHIRGGYIIPTQGPSLTIYENRNKPFELLVALDANKKASGRLYLDDGISINVNGEFSEIEYTVENNTLTAKGSYNYKENQKLHEITILGAKAKKVSVNGSNASFTNGNNKFTVTVNLSMNSDFTLTWN